MRIRLTKIDEYQFLTCFLHRLWGSKSARFKDWQLGDKLAMIVGKGIAAIAEVSGEAFQSREKVWDNGLFPHRITLKFSHVLKPKDRPPILGDVRDVLTREWGPRYGWGILNQQVLESPQADIIFKSVATRPNSLEDYQNNLQAYLEEAKIKREQEVESKRKPGRPRKTKDLQEVELEEPERLSKKSASAHTKSQSELIDLGRLTGCSVWVASNDQRKTYRGRRLLDDCLKELPSLGLSDEAVRRISLIDVIWISQNSPVCAFEIETSTSIYSGLLRMSDLLSVVPALNIQIYIVAPRDRHDRVMNELSRPTFRKIGLSDYCRYIPTEELSALLQKVKGFGGHIQLSILDTIAIALEDEEDRESP